MAKITKDDDGTPTAEVRLRLQRAHKHLQEVLDDELLLSESPAEVQTAMHLAVGEIDECIGLLRAPKVARRAPGTPTPQQGQFLAYIREYMRRNYGGVAPTHSVLQRFFGLTAPSVNSMLVRLEKAGFIRRVPRQARGIELTLDESLVPKLDRRFFG